MPARIYIALLRENADGSYEVSFPDLPGIVTAGDTLEEAIEEAEEVLEYALQDWTNPDGPTVLPKPRTIEQLSANPAFADMADGATIAEIEYEAAG